MYISKRKKTQRNLQEATDIAEPIEREEGAGVSSVDTDRAEESAAPERVIASDADDALFVSRELLLTPTDVPTQSPVLDKDILVKEDPQDLDEPTSEQESETYEQFKSNNTDVGILRVQASAGSSSIPLSNVKVTVYRDFSDGRHIFYRVSTNADGVADGMILPAPPKENSVIGNGSAPFASYGVEAIRDGLRTELIENVPIFSGIKSIQPLNMNVSAEV